MTPTAPCSLVVHPKGWDDVPQNAPPDEDKNPRPEASMFYAAYFKSADKTGADKNAAPRPITFLFNGGPGSSTVWLHMGAFGPKRVVTADDSHTPAAPYEVVNNDFSLLDASDLVFVDAPGTGFSRIAGKDREKAFYGIDQDAQAFADFVVQFLSKYGRWNSAKYLFGESYGTLRSAVLVNLLETDRLVDFNGVILLSQILNVDNGPDDPQFNIGMDLPYELVLPSFAASAWYHHKLPEAPAQLAPLLAEVEKFAMSDYAMALEAGSTLPDEQRQAIAAKLHQYTGLPVDYILKADLRVNGRRIRERICSGTATAPPAGWMRALQGRRSIRSARRRSTIRNRRRSPPLTSPLITTTCASSSTTARIKYSNPRSTIAVGIFTTSRPVRLCPCWGRRTSWSIWRRR